MATSTAARTGFRGWPEEALTFFAELESNNTKAWWDAHRSAYEANVRGPMEAFVAALPEAYRPMHVFRPFRDVRFSKDKRPYKTNIGAVSEREGGAMYYVHLSAIGLMAATGYHGMAADQLERYRAAVDDERAGTELEAIVADLERAGYDIGGDALKTAPRGWPRDHPRIRLLRQKEVHAGRSWPPARWLSTRQALDRVVAVWEACEPLNRWLDGHVGPSTLPPPEPR
jgi:uncharacterized protein (TIGR02453 family)